jgi:hypothetical protein
MSSTLLDLVRLVEAEKTFGQAPDWCDVWTVIKTPHAARRQVTKKASAYWTQFKPPVTHDRFARRVADFGSAGAWLERVFVDLAPGTNLAIIYSIEGCLVPIQYGTGPRVPDDVVGPLIWAVAKEVPAKGPRYAFKKMAELERAYGFDIAELALDYDLACAPGRSMTEEEALYGI